MATETTGELVHKWERAGLGKAPYRFIGFREHVFQAIPGDPNCPIQPGTSCDYCGQGIRYAFHFQSSDGRGFKVGSDCFYGHTHLSNAQQLDSEVRRLRREQDQKRRAARKASVEQQLDALLADESVRESLRAKPHSRAGSSPFFATKTALDEAEWLRKHAGAQGRAALLKMLMAIGSIVTILRG